MHGGLTGEARTPGRGTPLQAATTAVAVLAALALLVSGCAAGGTGARDEGPAFVDSSASPAAPTPAPSATVSPSGPSAESPSGSQPADTPDERPVPGVDQATAARLVLSDPRVSPEVKDGLRPCVAGEYPVDVAQGDLTGGMSDDLVVNVLTCGDGVGVGTYVYRDTGRDYENVFAAEESPVYAEIDSSGNLVVSKQVYEEGDSVANPSGEDVITYRWVAGRFVKVRFVHNDLGRLGAAPSPLAARH